MKRKLLALALAAIAVSAAGCGYTLVGLATNIPEDIEAIRIDPLVNETTRAEVEQILTSEIVSEFVTRKRFRLVEDVSEADAEIQGAVKGFVVRPLTFDADGRATEYEITIEVQVLFHDRIRDEPLWSNERYIFKSSYVVEDVGASYFDQERDAIEEAAERFAETMVIDLLEGF